VLVQLDVSSEEAQLRSAEADAELARVAEERARNLRKDNVISQSEFDTADATFKQKTAQVDNMRAIIAKKTIRAPFDGEAGIRQVNPGQMVPAGQQIVSLQALDPIFVNFALPQQRLSELKEGLVVRVTTDAVPGHQFKGKLTAINSQVDEVTRNIQVQATLENKERLLQPGMFVTATVILPQEQTTIVIPATAISYAPFGDSVFVIEKKHDEKTKKDGLVLRQQFIRTGETRGDFVAVLQGLKPGEQVASTGVFKLRNGAPIVIDNKMAPHPELHPTPPNS
jgi:membrane fusion protein, multidrug efflux system